MPYELTIAQFKGPLEKLLELIEARELDITDISLAQVTDDFLSYVKKIAEAADEKTGASKESLMRLLADFVVVASRLILLKSKALLPFLPTTEEEDADMKDLELRLRLFKRLRPAIKALASRWGTREEAFGRPYLAHIAQSDSFFYPGAVTLSAIQRAIGKLVVTLQEFARKEETIRGVMISLEAKMEEMIQRVSSLKEVSFSNIREFATRAEIIVTFLAILHLARDRSVSLEQKNNFSDIIIRRSETGNDS